MGSYIRSVRWLSARSKRVASPPEMDVVAARHVLSHSPVGGYPSFTGTEVRLLALYRVASGGGLADSVWQSIVAARPEAWIYAIHEAIEMQAFTDIGADPFSKAEWRDHLPEAHLRATIYEVQFLRDWARQEGLDAPEVAIAMENPMRNVFPAQHRTLLATLQARQGWLWPTDGERRTAQRFWQAILRGEQQ